MMMMAMPAKHTATPIQSLVDGVTLSTAHSHGMATPLDRAWYGLGLALIRQGRFEEAATALKRNVELQPMSPYGWYQLARVHMDRHEPQEARKILQAPRPTTAPSRIA